MKIFEADNLTEQREYGLVSHQDDGHPLVFHLIKEDEWIIGYWDNGIFFCEYTDGKYSELDIDKVILL